MLTTYIVISLLQQACIVFSAYSAMSAPEGDRYDRGMFWFYGLTMMLGCAAVLLGGQ